MRPRGRRVYSSLQMYSPAANRSRRTWACEVHSFSFPTEGLPVEPLADIHQTTPLEAGEGRQVGAAQGCVGHIEDFQWRDRIQRARLLRFQIFLTGLWYSGLLYFSRFSKWASSASIANARAFWSSIQLVSTLSPQLR